MDTLLSMWGDSPDEVISEMVLYVDNYLLKIHLIPHRKYQQIPCLVSFYTSRRPFYLDLIHLLPITKVFDSYATNVIMSQVGQGRMIRLTLDHMTSCQDISLSLTS